MTRAKLAIWLETIPVRWFIIGVILLNAAILGLETSPVIMAVAGPLLITLDQICLGFFVVELAVKLYAFGWRFFANGWNLFDFAIVGAALVPGSETISVVRALRILRLLRVVSVAPRLRRVVEGFISALPGMASVFLLMGLIFYIGAVMATTLFGESFPQWFGHIGKSAYTLFQVMTLESWSMGIVRPVMEVHPWAWAFFVPFIMIATFTILNLFIGVIVSTMQELSIQVDAEHQETVELLGRIEADLAQVKKKLEKRG